MEDVTAVAARVDALQQLTQQPAAGFAALLAAQTAQAASPSSGASASAAASSATPVSASAPAQGAVTAAPAAAPAAAATASQAAPAAAATATLPPPQAEAATTIPVAGPSGPTSTLGQMLAGPVPNLPWSAVTPASASLPVGAAPAAAPTGAAQAQAGPGGMITPVDGRWSSPYGMRTHPVTGSQKMHSGQDIAAPTGTPIKAAAAGTVSYSGVMGGYGNVVIIDHGNGTQTRYAHCSTLEAKVGDKVSAGQMVARVGSTGMSTGPHLHFEVRRDGEAVDPGPFLNRKP